MRSVFGWRWPEFILVTWGDFAFDTNAVMSALRSVARMFSFPPSFFSIYRPGDNGLEIGIGMAYGTVPSAARLSRLGRRAKALERSAQAARMCPLHEHRNKSLYAPTTHTCSHVHVLFATQTTKQHQPIRLGYFAPSLGVEYRCACVCPGWCAYLLGWLERDNDKDPRPERDTFVRCSADESYGGYDELKNALGAIPWKRRRPPRVMPPVGRAGGRSWWRSCKQVRFR